MRFSLRILTLLLFLFSATAFSEGKQWQQLASNPAPDYLGWDKFPSYGHCCVWDSTTNNIYIWGGMKQNGLNNILFTMNLDSLIWREVVTVSNKPEKRINTSAVIIRDRKIVIFGGDLGGFNTASNDMWIFDINNNVWEEINNNGDSPHIRSDHSCIYDPQKNEMILFGGLYHQPSTTNWYRFNDLWKYNFDTKLWTFVELTGDIPEERSHHSTVFDENEYRMIVFGGSSDDIIIDNSIFELDLKNLIWHKIEVDEVYSSLSDKSPGEQSAIFDKLNNMFITAWPLKAFDLDLTDWLDLSSLNPAPEVRHSFSTIYDNKANRMILVGGTYGEGSNRVRYYDTWSLQLPLANKFKILSPTGGEIFKGGNIESIQWFMKAPNIKELQVLLSSDAGTSFNLIASVPPDSDKLDVNLPSITSKNCRFFLKAYDNELNVVSECSTRSDFTIDSSPPTNFDLTSPILGQYTDKVPLLKWSNSIDNECDILKYEVYIDDIFCAEVTPTILPSYRAGPLSEGNHSWKVIAFNNLLLQTVSDHNGYFQVDTGKPFLEVVSPIDNSSHTGKLQVEFSVSDTVSGISASYLFCDGERIKTFNSTEFQISWEWNLNNVSEGAHQIEFRSIDNAGNIASKILNITTGVFYNTSGEIENGGFELKNFTDWDIGTTWDVFGTPVETEGRPPEVTSNIQLCNPYEGSYFASIGGLPLAGTGAGPFYSWISQTVRMPSDLITADLTFQVCTYCDNTSGIQRGYYQIEDSDEKYSMFEFQASDNQNWTKYYQGFSSQYAGKLIRITFEAVVMAGGQRTSLFVDDVQMSVERSGTIVEEERQYDLPKDFLICQNYPNPFNPITTIRYEIPHQEYINIKIFDMLGKEIGVLIDKQMDAGIYTMEWNATDYSSGIYILRMQAGSFIKNIKMIVIQ